MGNTLYINASAGMSGDMFVGAMLDLGADQKHLETILKQLPVKGFEIAVTEVEKAGVKAKDFDVILDAEHENHDHDMKYLHGKNEKTIFNFENKNAIENVGNRGSRNTEESLELKGREAIEKGSIKKESGSVGKITDRNLEEDRQTDKVKKPKWKESMKSGERNLSEILDIICSLEMPPKAKEYAVSIFEILARGEAKAHKTPVEEVYFHEKGAVDCIVDIVSAAFCFADLEIDEVIIPRLCDGSGTIRCRKGLLPVPVPAVVQIARQNELEIHSTEVQGELVTPTGAAIAAAIRTTKKLPDSYKVRRCGIGAGKRKYETEGILRAFLIA